LLVFGRFVGGSPAGGWPEGFAFSLGKNVFWGDIFMARVKSFSDEMVKSLSGIIDFYYWKGIPCARQWPRKTNLPPSAAVLGSRLAFKKSREDLRLLSGATRAAWAACCAGKRQPWLDYYTSIYMRLWKNYKKFPPVVGNYFFSAG
jgi:hypothetical protein